MPIFTLKRRVCRCPLESFAPCGTSLSLGLLNWLCPSNGPLSGGSAESYVMYIVTWSIAKAVLKNTNIRTNEHLRFRGKFKGPHVLIPLTPCLRSLYSTERSLLDFEEVSLAERIPLVVHLSRCIVS